MNVLSLTSSLFAIIAGVYGFYKVFVRPKRVKTKLLKLLEMIEAWFDFLDINLEKELNLAELNNLEKKVQEYIENNLATYKIKPNKKIIRRWNTKMGIKRELIDSVEIFEKFSRIPSTGIFLNMFFYMLVANVYSFYNAYTSDDKQQLNFAEVEIPVKFFKFYVRSL